MRIGIADLTMVAHERGIPRRRLTRTATSSKHKATLSLCHSTGMLSLAPSMSTPAQAPGIELLKTFLSAHPQIQHVEIKLVEYSNNVRGKSITVKRALELAMERGGFTTGGCCLFRMDRYDRLVPEHVDKVEPDHVVIDWSTLKPAAIDDKTAEVLARVESPHCTTDKLAMCPRTILERIVNGARSAHSVEFKVAWELEFCLLESQHATETVWTPRSYLPLSGMRHPTFAVVKEMVEHIENNGVGVWSYHAEVEAPSPGGFEIALSPSDPLEAADRVIHAMGVIKDLAQKHGYFATLHPLPFEQGPAQGQHIHLSISNRALADSFLAGMLTRLGETTAFLLGGYDSYSSTRANAYGEGHIFWGIDKCTSIRKHGKAHWEVRIPDILCNPHLQLAALLVSGLDGVSKQLRLEGSRLESEVLQMDEVERKEAGIGKLPGSLEEAIKGLEKEQEWWSRMLGPECIEGYLASHKAELGYAEKLTKDERRVHVMSHI